MLDLLIFVTVFATTYFGVERFRQWSLKKDLYDIPNERSSHKTPTPLGGGLIIVLVTNLAFILYFLYFSYNIPIFFFLGANLIALISWLDDIYSIPSIWRFLVHSVGAFLAVYGVGFWEIVYIPFWGEFELGFAGHFLTFLWIVWLTNAFNFMDGIDGIAGVQAFTAGMGWFLVSYFLKLEITAILGGIVAFSSLGFLIHNWQPAKIFMGDVGSAFLGYTFAVMPLLAIKETSLESISLMPLLGVLFVSLFVADSVFTFLKRLIKGEKVWKAHRKHFYQKLVIKGYSHQFVTIVYGLVSTLVIVVTLFCLY